MGTLAQAREPFQEFLEALRAAGYHDTAAEYLQRVVTRPDVDDDFKRRHSYELGSVWIDAARATSDPVLRDRLWIQGLSKLKEFVESNGDHSLVIAANTKIADTLLDRGRTLVALADQGRDKEKKREDARAMFVEAAKVLGLVEKHHVAEFARQSKDADRAKRNQLGAPVLSARLALGQALSEVAKTYDPGAPQAKKALEDGIKEYRALYDKYASDGFAAAYIARVYEARNLFDLGKPDDALARLKDVMDVDAGDQSLRDFVLTPAYLLALKAWHKKSDFASAIDKAAKYAGSPRGAEEKRPEWIEMQYLLAVAYQQQAETLKPGDANRSKLQAEARKLAAEVIRHRSDVQSDARALLTKLGRAPEEIDTNVTTFAEAVEKAVTAIEAYTAAKSTLDSTAEHDKGELEQLQKQVREAHDAAYSTSRMAISLADDKSDPNQLNSARFFLCYLHWEYGQAESAEHKRSSHYFDAAVLGDFLARRFPDHANARQAMAIAMASYQKIRQDVAEVAGKDAEAAGRTEDEVREAVEAAVVPWSNKISDIAQYAVAKWPDTQESTSAVAVLASIAVEREQYDQAIEFIKKISPGTAARADTELRVGRAMWSNYVRAKKRLEADSDGRSLDDKDRDEALKRHAITAQGLLESALNSHKTSGEINSNVVLGLWALVQSYLTTSQPERAIPWLEHEKVGLLTLVNNKHEAAEIEGLLFDAYRLALRAYIGVKPQQLERAVATMDALEKITGDDAKGREMLTGLYIAMGRDLQKEIAELVAKGNSNDVESLSTAFEAFLKRLAERDSGNTFNSLFWVADTYTELGAGMAKAGANSPVEKERSTEYSRQAVAALEKILERDKSDADFLPDKYLALVQMRLIKAYRGANEHDDALKLLVKILKEKPNVLDAQFEAAYTYQEYADADRANNGKYFRHAILGGQKDDYRAIWGWNALAEKLRTQLQRSQRDAGDPEKAEQARQYRQRYQEARYNSVYCKFALAQLEEDTSKKKQLLEAAKRDIYLVYTIVDPQFGGGEWKAKNQTLLRTIQTTLGEEPVGLQEFEQKKQQQLQTTAATK